MDFALNDEQKMMIDTIRRFIAEELHPLEQQVEDQGFLAPEVAKAKPWGCTPSTCRSSLAAVV
jgi:acyl-CoA dehydrogenase